MKSEGSSCAQRNDTEVLWKPIGVLSSLIFRANTSGMSATKAHLVATISNADEPDVGISSQVEEWERHGEVANWSKRP